VLEFLIPSSFGAWLILMAIAVWLGWTLSRQLLLTRREARYVWNAYLFFAGATLVSYFFYRDTLTLIAAAFAAMFLVFWAMVRTVRSSELEMAVGKDGKESVVSW
jgi:hypothetical protein